MDGNTDMWTQIVDRLTPPPPARQVWSEFNSFLQSLTEHHVRSYLEVGAYRGGTFFRVMRRLPLGSFGVSVDNNSRSLMRGRAEPLTRVGDRLRRLGYRIETVFGDSHAPATVESVRRLGPFDAVLIDADHTYDAAKRDWQDYGPMARKLVAFHDIAIDHVTRSGKSVEVARLWREISASTSGTREYIAPGSKMGIGVIVRV